MLTNKEKNQFAEDFSEGSKELKNLLLKMWDKGINDYLEAHEIVKVSLLKSCDAEVMEVALDLCSALKAELVQTVGRSIILYRPSKKKLINLKEV